ncbi:MAG: minor capsid protein [Defluviitaleaceae bacterium]|nr:minor capsid protein [Defluviitaleaceae bacterium]
MKRQFLDNFYHPIFEVQSGFNIGWDIAGIDETQIESLLRKPWTLDNLTFSDRIWRDKDQLVNELQTQLTQGLITGTPSNVLINNLADKLNTSKSNAARLVMTESAAIVAIAKEAVYRELEVELIRILATLDKKTSEICRKMDGIVIRIDDYKVGVTVPPFHPWCRSTTVPHFDDNVGQRAARDEGGKTYYVPNEMKYPEWKKTFVDGGDKSNLQEMDSTLKSFTEKVDSISGITPGYREVLIQRFNNGTNKAKEVFNRFVPNNSVSTGTAKGAWYSPREKRIHMNFVNDLSNKRGSGTTFFHEQGHLIDYANRASSEHISALDSTLNLDYNNLIRNTMRTAGTKRKTDAYRILGEVMRGEDRELLSSVSDILHGLSSTGNTSKIKGYYGHWDKGYWKSILPSTEAFAHLFEAQFDPARLAVLQQYFPETIKKFDDILGGLIQ